MKKRNYIVMENEKIADSTYAIKLEGETGDIVVPGQFVNIALKGFYLRRPISVCFYTKGEMTLIYKVVGEGTKILSEKQPGDVLDVLGFLGNGYDLEVIPQKAVLIGGGAGIPPIYGLAKALLERGKEYRVILGFATSSQVFYEEKFRALGLQVTVITEDGSYGEKGFVTDALKEKAYLCACGPEPMLRALDEMATGGQYSFESRMACGFGACMGCSCQSKYGNLRICKDGPVLKREVIKW